MLHSFSGVRPLFDDGKGNPSAVTRDYVFDLDETGGAPLLNVFGGKITTFRELAERGMQRLKHIFPNMGGDWTEKAPLPGGEIPNADYESFANSLRDIYPGCRASSCITMAVSMAPAPECGCRCNGHRRARAAFRRTAL